MVDITRFYCFLFLCCLSATVFAQDTLQIIDEMGNAMPFATVTLEPEHRLLGTADEHGQLILPDTLSDNQLIGFFYLGYPDATTFYGQLKVDGFQFTFLDAIVLLASPEIVGRRNEIAGELPYQIETIPRSAIQLVQARTSADALAELSGVYVQKSQFGGGSPVVRGFEANRVLLVVDGVRMNNAIYRSGHLQNAISVDPLALDQLEVIYGAGALAYGSDAIGGVIHFRTQQPDFSTAQNKGARTQVQWKVGGAVAYQTAANSYTPSVKLEYGQRNWAGLTLASFNSSSHLRSGAQRPDRFPEFGLRNTFVDQINGRDTVVTNDDPNVQIGTAYQQFNLLQKLRFRLKNRLELHANFQYSTTSNLPRYDALTERRNGQFRWARWDYGPQTRALASLRLQDRRPTKWYDGASYLLSHQFVEEDRLQRRFGDPLTEESLVNVGATNLQVDYNKALSLLDLRYGFDLRYDKVNSTALLTGSPSGPDPSALNTRYPSAGSDLAAVGTYAEGSRRFGNNWQLRGGLRWSRQRLSARFGADDPIAWPGVYLAGIQNTESAVTGALGLTFDNKQHRWRTLWAQGFRAPNIDDFAKFREQDGFVQVPNPTLQPERSQTVETSYRYVTDNGRFRASATAYHTWLRKAVIRQNGTLPDGSESFVSRGDTLFVQTNVNAERARVYGFDVNIDWQLWPGLRLTSDFHYLRGRRQQEALDGQTLTLPQDHIPPPYGQTGLRWQQNDWSAGARVRYQLAKDVSDYAVGQIRGSAATGYTFSRLGTADNLELTPVDADGNFTGSYGWWTLNLDVGYQINDRCSLRLKVDNLLDRHYRTFASGVSAAGRDVGIALMVGL